MYLPYRKLYSLVFLGIVSFLPLTSTAFAANSSPQDTGNTSANNKSNKLVADSMRYNDPRDRGAGRGDWYSGNSSGGYYYRNGRNNSNWDNGNGGGGGNVYFYTEPYGGGGQYYYNNPNNQNYNGNAPYYNDNGY